MIFKETKLQGCFIIEPKVFHDDRGFFYEYYNKHEFETVIGEKVDFVQDNMSKSSYGVIRGLHFQKGKNSQAKLVSVLEGKVLDIAVDLRKDSKTFGQHFSIELSQENKRKLFVPKGFAHGFSVLSETAIFAYKCDEYYNKDSEDGIVYNDADLAIDWQIPKDDVIITSKDINLPKFKNAYTF